MVPTSPTAILAVPERALPERAEAKGAEGAEVPFAGLMAQFVQAPNPTEPPKGPQVPPPEAQTQPRRPLPQAEVAQVRGDTPRSEGSAPEGRVSRPRRAPEQAAKAQAPTEEAASGPSSQEASATAPVPAPPLLAAPVSAAPVPAAPVPAAPGPPVQSPLPVDALAQGTLAQGKGTTPVTRTSSGVPLLPSAVPPGQPDAALATTQVPGAAPQRTMPSKGEPAEAGRTEPPRPEGLTPAAAQPTAPGLQVPGEAMLKATTDGPTPPSLGSTDTPRASAAKPPSLPTETTVPIVQTPRPEAAGPAPAAVKPAPPGAAFEPTVVTKAEIPLVPAQTVPAAQDPTAAVEADTRPKGIQPSSQGGVSASSGWERTPPEMPHLPPWAASSFSVQADGEQQAAPIRVDGKGSVAVDDVEGATWLQGAKQAQPPVVEAPPALVPTPALVPASVPQPSEGPVPVEPWATPSTPENAQPPVDSAPVPAAPTAAKPLALPAGSTLSDQGSTRSQVPAGQAPLPTETVPQRTLEVPLQPATPVPPAAPAVPASGPSRTTPKATTQPLFDPRLISGITTTPTPSGGAGMPQPGPEVPSTASQVAAPPVPVSPDGAPRLSALRAAAAEPAASLKEALARQFPEPVRTGTAFDLPVPAPGPAFSSPLPGAGPTPVERSASRPSTPAPTPASDRPQLGSEAPNTTPVPPERPEALATSAEGAVLKTGSSVQSATLPGPDGSAMAASTTSRTQAPASTQAAIPSQAPSPAAATPNPLTTQVEGGVRWMLRGGAQEARLQLHPESLGQVTIHLRVEGGEVHARLWITEPASVQAVQEGRPHLEHSLREQGLQLGSFDLHQGHRPFQEAPSAPVVPERRLPEVVPARQEAPAAPALSILNPHHVELYA